MRHAFAICAIMKDEGRYLREWIEFHASVGCTKFFLYDNESTDDTASVVAPYVRSGLVELTAWTTPPAQLTAYAHALGQRFQRKDADWCAFIDLDEFLVPESAASVPDVLADYDDCAALAVHWLTFGSAGHVARSAGLVIETYTRRLPEGHSVNQHYKTIVNFGRARAGAVINSHGFHLLGGPTRNTKQVRYSPPDAFRPLWRRLSRPTLERLHLGACEDGALKKVGKAAASCISHEGLRLHHYFSKSREDWDARLRRGDVDEGAYLQDKRRLFAKYDLGDIEDLAAARFAEDVRSRMSPSAGDREPG